MEEASKSQAAWVSVGAAAFLMVLKLAVGLLTGSLGILAEASNSALDIVASLVTVAALWYAARPADADHPYGHGKAENLGAFVQSGIMLATCAGIGWEGLRRLLVAPEPVQPSVWAFAVMGVSVAVSGARVRALRRAAALHGSQALEADALHFYTDIYTGGAVLAGLAAVWLGARWELPLLARADALAALVVVGVLVRMTVGLGLEAVGVLLDRSHNQTDEIAAQTRGVPGVVGVHAIRTRQVGPQNFVDMRIQVARTASFEESHAVATAVEQALHALLPRADVVVHVDPIRPPDESTVQAIYATAGLEGLAIHHVTLHDVAGRGVAHLHIEMPPMLTLAEAHGRADIFERRLLAELPVLEEVVSHLEPTSDDIAAGPDVTPRAASLLRLVEQLTAEMPEIVDCHHVTVQRVGDGFHLAFHCTFAPTADLRRVHTLMAELERRLRDAIPSLRHIVIHPEPAEEAQNPMRKAQSERSTT